MTTTLLNRKISEVDNKIRDTNGLVTTTVFNTKIGDVENKIPDVIGLFKKTDYNSKVSDIEDKYFTASDYNKFTKEILDTKLLKKSRLVDKYDICNLVKISDLNTKLARLATKAELKAEQDKIVKLQAFDSHYFRGENVLVIMVFKICWFINKHLIG